VSRWRDQRHSDGASNSHHQPRRVHGGQHVLGIAGTPGNATSVPAGNDASD